MQVNTPVFITITLLSYFLSFLGVLNQRFEFGSAEQFIKCDCVQSALLNHPGTAVIQTSCLYHVKLNE